MCRLPPQTIALIALGAFAMVVALFSTTVTISDGIIAIWTRWNAKRTKTVQQRYRENKYEIGRGELCLWYIYIYMPWKSLVHNFYQSDIRDDEIMVSLSIYVLFSLSF